MALRATIHQTIKFHRRYTIIAAIIAIVVAVAGFASTAQFFIGYLGAPVILTESTLNTLGFDLLPLYKTSIRADAGFDTGQSEEQTTTINGIPLGATVTAHFGILTVGDLFLLIKTPYPINESVTEYSGVLVSAHSDKVGSQVRSELMTQVPDIAGSTLPFILDTSYAPWPWFGGLVIELAMLVWAAKALLTVAPYRNVNNHPVMKTLARFGDSDAILSQIDDEMLQDRYIEVYELQLTRNWLIHRSQFPNKFEEMHFLRLRDVMRVYHSVKSINGTKVHSVTIMDRNGEQFDAGTDEKEASAMIAVLTQRVPWTIVGYNADIEKSWQNDRAGFVRTVDDRRKQMTTRQ